mgnify:CR=1 FL=1
MKMTLAETAERLLQAQKIVLTAHVNPDGDAIGSSLGLMHLLKGLGKDVTVLLDDTVPPAFSILPAHEAIQKPEGEREADLLVILDTGPDRIGGVATCVKAARCINIDHHRTNAAKIDTYLDDTRAATAEIVYELAKEMKTGFSTESAICIYTGLATDTGFFRYSNVTSRVMRAAAELIDCGARPNVISEALEQKPYQMICDTAEALQHIERFAGGRAAGIFLDRATTERMESTEGFIDLVRIIEGVDVAVVLKAKEDTLCRVSMRSKGADVSAIAAAFHGGGHTRAAGCTLEMPFEEAKKTIMAAISAGIGEEH